MFYLVARAHREGPRSKAYQRHAMKRYDFMWLTKDGILMSGMNGSQFWDVALISEAMIDTGLARLEENKESLLKAFEWIDAAQIRENPLHFDPSYRPATKGSWPFRYFFDISSLRSENLTNIFLPLVQENKVMGYPIVLLKVLRRSYSFNITWSMSSPFNMPLTLANQS